VLPLNTLRVVDISKYCNLFVPYLITEKHCLDYNGDTDDYELPIKYYMLRMDKSCSASKED